MKICKVEENVMEDPIVLTKRKLLIASDSVMRKKDIEVLFDIQPQRLYRQAKQMTRTVNGKSEEGTVKFNQRLVKTWAVFQAAGLDRAEMIANLKSSLK